jgi:hypothetical protein
MLSRAKRDAVWPVFEEYRAQLASRRLKEVDDAYRDAAQLIAKDGQYPYSAIVRSGQTREHRSQMPALCDHAPGKGVGVSERRRDEHKGREG